MSERAKIQTIVQVLIIVFICSGASGFDGQRKGFSLGSGITYSPISKSSSENALFDKNRAVIGLQISLGYAFDDIHQIALDALSVTYDPRAGIGKAPLEQMLTSLSLYYYFSPDNRSLYVAGGIGLMGLLQKKIDGYDYGFGARIGGGWQFNEDLQVGIFAIVGSTDGEAGKVDHFIVGLIINAIAI